MRTGLIARKIGMSSIFNEKGRRTPVTFLHLDNCQVVGNRSKDKDGYDALILGIADKKEARAGKSVAGFFKKNKIQCKKKLKEFRISSENFLDIGTVFKADFFQKGQFVDVQGKSIGKGFAGSMKRHNFGGLEATHGVSISHRSHGSTGGCQDPGRVFKNKKMAGHMGAATVTMQNLLVRAVDVENNLILVEGGVPGAKNSFVFVSDAIKKNIHL